MDNTLDSRFSALKEALLIYKSSHPDTRVIERHGWFQIINPHGKTIHQNTVFLSEFSDNLSLDEINQAVQEVIALYKKDGLKFRWVIGPWTKPTNLSEVLVKNGMRLGSLAYGMTRNSEFVSQQERDSAITIEPVSKSNIEVWINTCGKAWTIPPEARESLRASIANSLFDRNSLHILASFQGKPAGIASMAFLNGAAYFYGTAVLPEYRRNGIFTALIEYRCYEALKRNMDLVCLYAYSDTSFPLLKKMGFEVVLESPQYYWEPSNALPAV